MGQLFVSRTMQDGHTAGVTNKKLLLIIHDNFPYIICDNLAYIYLDHIKEALGGEELTSETEIKAFCAVVIMDIQFFLLLFKN